MKHITKELAELLDGVSRPGDYFVSGHTELLAPRIEVEGVGPVALPLLATQAKALIKLASQAPFGRGGDTVLDTTVRRTWQIGPDRVRIGGKHWDKTLAGIVARAAEGLGVGDPIAAEFYKLLIYDKGSFFVGHRDTEKSPGMFATLVIALPGASAGGELVVRHNEREARLDLANDDPSEVAFAAFYADCVHEVLPVTQGFRATLVFNLVRKAKGKPPAPPNYGAEADRVAVLLDRWAKGSAPTASVQTNGEVWPLKLVLPLEHAYTPAELGFETLKGADAAVARLLIAAAPKAAVDLHLAHLNVWESGSAEYTGRENWHYRRGQRDAGKAETRQEFEVGEIFDSGRSLSDWRRPDGQPASLGELPVEDDEVAPADALEDMDPDEEHFHEATGNEGASFDRTYARAALVLWPSANRLAVLNQAGVSATLPYLESLATQWRADGARAGSPLKAEALELARLVLTTWSPTSWSSRTTSASWQAAFAPNRGGASTIDDSEADDDEDGDDAAETVEESKSALGLARILAVLTKFKDAEGVLVAFDVLTAQTGHAKSDHASIMDALALLPAKGAAQVLVAIVEAHAINEPGSCAALLALAQARLYAKQPSQLTEATARLVRALPGDPSAAPKDQWGRSRVATVDAALVANLVLVADNVDQALAKQLAEHVLAWPKHFDLDGVVVPAVKRLVAETRRAGPSAVALHAAATAHLQHRTALPLSPPQDWSRPSTIGCQCEHCRGLARFLADPAQPEWTLRAAQQHRTHVEAEIKRAGADVDMRTERKGSPHQLICRKNQASYTARVRQRKQDLADLAALSPAETPKPAASQPKPPKIK